MADKRESGSTFPL